MEHYISQLISDIHQATWRVRPPHEIWEDVDVDNEAEQEDISYVEEYIYGEPEKISDITGIASEFLPQPEKLTEDQAGRLASELENLLNIFHFYPDFPEAYPLHLRYPFIRNLWDEEHVPISFGESHIELCSFEQEFCPFEGYCNTCQEYADELKHDLEVSDKECTDDTDLPF